LARQLQSQGLAAAAEYQRARAAVDDILVRISSHRGSSSSSSAQAAGAGAAASNSVAAAAAVPQVDGSVQSAANAANAADAANAAAAAQGDAGSGAAERKQQVFGRCASLKAYNEFQATAARTHLPSNAGVITSTTTCPSSSGAADSSSVAGPAPGAGVRCGSGGGRAPSASAAAARAAQQAGLQLTGSSAAGPAGRAST
jgi:hypothetical protein